MRYRRLSVTEIRPSSSPSSTTGLTRRLNVRMHARMPFSFSSIHTALIRKSLKYSSLMPSCVRIRLMERSIG